MKRTDPETDANGCSPIAIRPYKAEDAATLVDVFRAAVRGIASQDYSAAQLRAWAPDQIEVEAFARGRAGNATWIAEVSGRVAGFGDLEPDGHVDMLYVHPDFKRRGVGRALIEHIETQARELEIRRLYTEASITARPVFERQGFRVIVAQTVVVRGESLTNFRMEKRLAPSPGSTP